MRLLHAGDPDGGRGPARARTRRRRARRSSTCSPGSSAAARATSRSSTRSRRSPAREPRAQPPLRGRADTRRRGARGRRRAAHVRRAARARSADRRRPRGAGRRAQAIASPRSLANEPETVELYWACQWLGAVFVPLSHRVSESRARVLRRRLGRGARVREPARCERSSLADEQHAARSTSTSATPSIKLYTSGTTGRPKGVPRSHRAERAGGLSQALQHGYRPATARSASCRSTTRWAIHSLLAAWLVGGCYVCQPRWDAERRSADRARAHHIALSRPHALPRPRPRPAARGTSTRRRARQWPTRARR